MRLVIDLQGAQTGSRYRGIGRYSIALSKELVRQRNDWEVIIALSGLFPETLEPLYSEFADLLPRDNIRIWNAIGPTAEVDPDNRARREISERIREAFLESLEPDVLLVTSIFEGLGDDGLSTIGVLDKTYPTAVIVYDLIPLLNPDEHFRKSRMHRRWYQEKLTSFWRSDLLLAISESSRQEALSTARFPAEAVVNVSGACDSSFSRVTLSVNESRLFLGKLDISRPFIFYTGGADERKNLNRLISAFAALPTSVRRAHQLVFAGKMPDGNVARYLETAKSVGLSAGELLILGYVSDDELLKLYSTCALFAFPSLHEGLGLPPLEAMACGAPVVGARATSLPEIIGLEEALFDPLSEQEMTSVMHRGLVDPEFRKRLLSHGNQQSRKFTWKHSATTAWAALRALAPKRRHRPSALLNLELSSRFGNRALKILVLKLDHLGDFILGIPALLKLRARYPNAKIEGVVGSWNTDIARKIGIFDELHVLDYFRRKSADLPGYESTELSTLITRLGHYDIALDLRRQPDTRFILAGINADCKVGYESFNADIDSGISVVIPSISDLPFTTTALNTTSVSAQLIKVVDSVPADINDYLSMPSWAHSALSRQGAIAVFPKAGNPVREWPAERFRELVSIWQDSQEVTAITAYFANEPEMLASGLQEGGKLTIRLGLPFNELVESLATHELCLANNSGGGHLASFLGLKVLCVYSGHELHSEWGPQFGKSYVLHRGAQCSPCHGATRKDCPYEFFCLSDISVADVRDAASALLNDAGSNVASTADSQVGSAATHRNADVIVGRLLESIRPLVGTLKGDEMRELALVIEQNHLDYPLAPDIDSIRQNFRYDHTSAKLQWVGFSDPERQWRWTEVHEPSIIFFWRAGAATSGEIVLTLDANGAQRVLARLNGEAVYEGAVAGAGVQLRIAVNSLRNGVNALAFSLPDAKRPGHGDSRRLGLAVRSLEIVVPLVDPATA